MELLIKNCFRGENGAGRKVLKCAAPWIVAELKSNWLCLDNCHDLVWQPLLLSELQSCLLNCSNMDLQHSCPERPTALLKFITCLLKKKKVYLLSVSLILWVWVGWVFYKTGSIILFLMQTSVTGVKYLVLSHLILAWCCFYICNKHL